MGSELIVPHYTLDSGMGHLMRSLRIAISLDASLLITDSEHYSKVQSIHAAMPLSMNGTLGRIVREPDATHSILLFDTVQMDWTEVRYWKRFGITVGLDVGGSGREYLDYLIDTLPNKFTHRANYYQLGLSVPMDIIQAEQWPRILDRVLYYPSVEHAEYLPSIYKIFKARYIHFSCVAASEKIERIADEHGIPKIANNVQLYQNLHKFALFISHFGLSSIEALKARVPVVLFNLRPEHQQLSSILPFPAAFSTMKDLQYFCNRLDIHRFSQLVRKCKTIDIRNKPSINGFLDYFQRFLSKQRFQYCVHPVIGFSTDKVVYRDRYKTVYASQEPRQWYQYPYFTDAVSYDANYFHEEYKSQYGKTYLEDMASIERRMERRCRIIHRIVQKSKNTNSTNSTPVLLDLGCSYGAMLNVAKKHGYTAVGVDITQDVIVHIKNNSDHLAFTADISSENFVSQIRNFLAEHGLSSVQVISTWFVLEHFPNIQHLLHSLGSLLASGGVLAISVPNGKGILARKNFSEYCAKSPPDHYSLFTVSAMKCLLKKSGFSIVKVRSTGFHASRFPLGSIFSLFWRLLSRIFVLGDTFEVFAVKR